MSIPTDQNFESFLPVYDSIPENWEDARQFLVEQLKRISNTVNIREIGWWLDEELLSGKQLFPGVSSPINQVFRSIFRKVIDFGALPAAGTKSVPHGIIFDNNFTLIQLFASATDPVSFVAFPLPYADPINILNAVSLTMDATNINITVGIDRSAFTRCIVTIEYILEK